MVSFAGMVMLVAVMPGPIVSVLLVRVLAGEIGGALAFAAGAILADLSALLLAVNGAALFISSAPEAYFAAKVLGVGYLMFLTVALLRANGEFGLAPAARYPDTTILSVAAGAFAKWSSPYTLIFYMAFVPATLGVMGSEEEGVGALFAISLGIFAVVYGGYMLLAFQLRQVLSQPRYLRFLNRVLAGVLAATGLWMAVA
jgi:threonine/homoserine/homoserine lactone efflux protein